MLRINTNMIIAVMEKEVEEDEDVDKVWHS